VLFGLFMTANVAWPRAAVYDPAGGHWYLQYFSLLFLAGALLLGGLAYLRYRHVPGRVLDLN